MEEGKSTVYFATRRAALHVWIRKIGATMAMDIAKIEKIYMPVTAGRYLLTSHDCPDENGQNDFTVYER